MPRVWAMAFVSVFIGWASGGAVPLLRIGATSESIVVELPAQDGPVHIAEYRLYQDPAAHSEADRLVWWGAPTGAPIVVPRFVDGRDLLYSKFVVYGADGGPSQSHPQYVTDLSGVGAHTFPMPWPASKKGMSGIVDLEDLIALGCKYAKDNGC